MIFFLTGVAGIFGLAIGSFLNVAIDRPFSGESIVKGRSHCDFCKHTLSWQDLIPVASFLLLKGKCRYCKKQLSYKYPVVELITSIVFSSLTILFVRYPFSFSNMLELFYYLCMFSSFIIIFFSDLVYGMIPDYAVIFSGAISFVYTLLFSPNNFLNHMITGTSTFLFFFLLFHLTKKKGMGFGDVEVSFVMGMFLGFPVIVPTIYIAFLTGAIGGIILILGKKKKFFGSTIPFGPFLIGATCVGFFIGNFLWQQMAFLLGF